MMEFGQYDARQIFLQVKYSGSVVIK